MTAPSPEADAGAHHGADAEAHTTAATDSVTRRASIVADPVGSAPAVAATTPAIAAIPRATRSSTRLRRTKATPSVMRRT
jgi:hypothetical protein